MENFELREEIRQGDGTYFLQTSYNAESGLVQSVFYRDGEMFDAVAGPVDAASSKAQLRELTKETHRQNKRNFRLLLSARDGISGLSDPGPHLRLAEALLRRNLHREAIAEAESAIAKGSADSRAWMVLAEARYRGGDAAGALAAAGRGIELSPDYPDLHNLCGRIHLMQKQCRMAAESFKRAIKLNPYYGEPHLNLARAYLLNTILKQDYELSRDLAGKLAAGMERARQLNPFIAPEKFETLGRLVAEEEHEKALELLERLEPATGRSIVDDIILELYLNLIQGSDEFDPGRIESHLGLIRDMLDQNPTFADAWNALGILYTVQCKLLMDRAGEAFGKALEINENYHKAQKNLRLTENDRHGIFILLKALLD